MLLNSFEELLQVFAQPPPQASQSCFRERVGEWGEKGELQ